MRFNTLTVAIEAFIRMIRTEMLERVWHNWYKRMDHLRRSRRQQLRERNLQTLNYMGRTIYSNNVFINFSEFYVYAFFFSLMNVIEVERLGFRLHKNSFVVCIVLATFAYLSITFCLRFVVVGLHVRCI